MSAERPWDFRRQAQGSASSDPSDPAQEEAVPDPESEESAPAGIPASGGEGGDDTVQTDGAPTPEDSAQAPEDGEPTLEDSRVADGAQGQMTDPSGGTDNRNQAGQGQPTQSEGTQPGGSPEDETAVSAERETEILLAASLLCLLIGLAAVSLYPRKH